MNIKLLSQLLQVVGLLPLAAYPAVLTANAMQAAALRESAQRESAQREGGSLSQRALMGMFLGGTTAYPVVALACRAMASKASQSAETRELAWSAAPLVFLGALAALFASMERDEGE